MSSTLVVDVEMIDEQDVACWHRRDATECVGERRQRGEQKGETAHRQKCRGDCGLFLSFEESFLLFSFVRACVQEDLSRHRQHA
jgi:hypothetical protein